MPRIYTLRVTLPERVSVEDERQVQDQLSETARTILLWNDDAHVILDAHPERKW